MRTSLNRPLMDLSILSRRLLVTALLLPAAQAADADVSGVKSYLTGTLSKVKRASADFVEHANAYAQLVAAHGDPQKTFAAEKDQALKLVAKMQDDYKAMDSFGYETVEGIVAGIEKFAHYDVYLDAGLPKGAAPEEVSPLKLKLKNGEVIDREGSSFTYIIEPALWGGTKKWCVPVDLDGDGKITARESLPRPEVLTAVATDTDKKIGELLADAQAWQPTVADCYSAMVAMTPTLSDYFEDWKESRYSKAASGRFFAVSRISDMQGIMKSCAVMYRAVEGTVKPKDKALAKSIDTGFKDIFTFLDDLEAKEKRSSASLKPAVIDEMANQAKSKTDKLVPQIKQAAALAGVKVAG